MDKTLEHKINSIKTDPDKTPEQIDKELKELTGKKGLFTSKKK